MSLIAPIASIVIILAAVAVCAAILMSHEDEE